LETFKPLNLKSINLKSLNLNIDKYIIIKCAVIIITMMMTRVVNHIATYYIPISYRVVIGLNILCLNILPLLLIVVFFHKSKPITNFIVTFISVGIIFTILDGIWLLIYDVNINSTIFNPISTIPKLILAFGYGLIAISSGTIKKEFNKSVLIGIVIGIIGLLVILIDIPDLPWMIYKVIINDIPTL